MKIGIDAMGGDYAPDECIKAILEEANSENCKEHFFVFGEEQALHYRGLYRCKYWNERAPNKSFCF
jgi:fatty acid/phospholipid biosynthesis enzyme